MVFDFRLGRGRDGPKRFLGQFEGILQTDGYAAYDQVVVRTVFSVLILRVAVRLESRPRETDHNRRVALRTKWGVSGLEAGLPLSK